MKKILLLIAFGLTFIGLKAQQYPLFTNYITNTFGFNPAVAGMEPGVELRAMYRSQWLGLARAPETGMASVHARLGKLPIGLGGYVYSDEAGQLKRNGFNGILSLHQKLGKATHASLGVSFGYSKLRLGSDYFAQDMADQSLQNAVNGVWTPDMNVGLYIRHKGLFLGLSTPQFIQKLIDFSGLPDAKGQSELVRHYYGMAGYRAYFGKMYLEPSALVKYSPNSPMQVDGSVRFGTGTPLWVGASYRTGAAGAGMIGVELANGFQVAYAADVTTNGLSKASWTSHEVTLIYGFGKPKDRDGDGIYDRDDKCPDEPGPVDRDGCPEPKKEDKCKDTDKDGLCDVDDECPELPGPKSNKGCPSNDRDKDGVPDDVDKCPDEPGYRAYQGCPMNDRDNDGLRDDLDRCPDEAGPVSNYGCPFGKGDSDGDGVPDQLDQCPYTPGTKKNNGCPEVTPDQHAALNLAIQNLYFDTDQWGIKSPSKPHLDKLAKLMEGQRDWKVHISGHADARGSEEHNLTLSKNRAEAVMYYLMSKGVRREQLVVEYYGERIPADSGSTTSGLALNRRVEMEFIFD